MSDEHASITVRNTTPADFDAIGELCLRVYPSSPPWTNEHLASHLNVFPEGQLVAVNGEDGRLVGMAASLIVRWDNYDPLTSWREFTHGGHFTNHDPEGRTLYGAEVMVDPALQRRGIGRKLYAERRALVQRLGLLRIRAGARLRGYSKVADRMSPEEYVTKVVRAELDGPTLSFQLHEGFDVIAVVSEYLHYDPESLGYAAIIEWLNSPVAKPEDYSACDPRFRALTVRH